jgi:hypothetical protein
MMNLTSVPTNPADLSDAALITYIRAMESIARTLQTNQRLAFAKRQARLCGIYERQLEALWPVLDLYRAEYNRRVTE